MGDGWVSLVTQMAKNLPAMQETQVWSLGWEDALEKEMATHSSILAGRISWTEEPGGLQSVGHKESDTTERLTWRNSIMMGGGRCVSMVQAPEGWVHTLSCIIGSRGDSIWVGSVLLFFFPFPSTSSELASLRSCRQHILASAFSGFASLSGSPCFCLSNRRLFKSERIVDGARVGQIYIT